LRAALEALGGAELGRWLRELDGETAVRLDVRNVRRVVLALEVSLVSGLRMSVLQRKTSPPYNFIIIGLRRERETLYKRIDDRVDGMMEARLLAELEQLRDDGYGRWLPSMSGLGYRQLWAYLDGEMSLPEAVERIKFETHRFVRHQNNWFKPTDPRINWFDLDVMDETEILKKIELLILDTLS
jgi:tRNA dimethylallyltransferase